MIPQQTTNNEQHFERFRDHDLLISGNHIQVVLGVFVV
jgi:hypothetical protein